MLSFIANLNCPGKGGMTTADDEEMSIASVRLIGLFCLYSGVVGVASALEA